MHQFDLFVYDMLSRETYLKLAQGFMPKHFCVHAFELSMLFFDKADSGSYCHFDHLLAPCLLWLKPCLMRKWYVNRSDMLKP